VALFFPMQASRSSQDLTNAEAILRQALVITFCILHAQLLKAMQFLLDTLFAAITTVI